MISKKIIHIKSVYYKPDSGGDGSYYLFNPHNNTISNEDSCRELFEAEFSVKRNKQIAFACRTMDIKLVNRFFTHIENKLKLKPKTILFNTTEEDLIVIKYSPFWGRDNVTRGFLTLFIRCAAYYYNGNFEQAINDYKLTNAIKKSIYFFLNGNTEINSDFYSFNKKRVCSGELVDTVRDFDSHDLINFLIPKGKNKLKGYEKYMVNMSVLKD